MLAYFLYTLFILACLVMIISVLLQPGKADAGALFTSSVSSTAFGPRGTQTILAKITIGAAVLFMLLALSLSLPGVTGSRSVLQTQAEETTTTPSTPAPAQPPTVAPGTTTASPNETTPAANTNNAPAADTDGNAKSGTNNNANKK